MFLPVIFVYFDEFEIVFVFFQMWKSFLICVIQVIFNFIDFFVAL